MSENDEDNDYQALNAWAINEYLRNVAQHYAEETLNAYKGCPQRLFDFCKKSYKEVTIELTGFKRSCHSQSKGSRFT